MCKISTNNLREKKMSFKDTLSPCLHATRYGIRGCQVASKYLLI